MTVRTVVVFFCLAVCLAMARGQEQERKLVDRLLQPDMELQNKAQEKKFVADHGGPMNKKAAIGSFYVQKKKTAKEFAAAKDVSTREFEPQSFRGKKDAAVAKPQREIVNANRSVPTAGVRDVRPVHDSNKIVDGRDYSGKRPFLDRGKSQKSLDRQNPPMTIDQVRELLNKNK
jgi:hypothetical protein